MKELPAPRWLGTARILAAVMAALVLVALATNPIDQSLFNAAALTIAGLVLMGFVELKLQKKPTKKKDRTEQE